MSNPSKYYCVHPSGCALYEVSIFAQSYAVDAGFYSRLALWVLADDETHVLILGISK